MIQTSRRSFLLGLGAAVCAPAIIRPGLLMPVKQIIQSEEGGGIAVRCITSLLPNGGILEYPLADVMLAGSLLSQIAGVAIESKGGIKIGDIVAFRQRPRRQDYHAL